MRRSEIRSRDIHLQLKRHSVQCLGLNAPKSCKTKDPKAKITHPSSPVRGELSLGQCAALTCHPRACLEGASEASGSVKSATPHLRKTKTCRCPASRD